MQFNFKKFGSVVLLFFLVYYLLDARTIVQFFFGLEVSVAHFKNISLIVIIIFLFILSLQHFLSARKIKIILAIIFIPISVLNIFVIGYIIYFKTSLDYAAISAILDTNASETKEFIATFISAKILLVLFFILLPFLTIYFYKPVKIKSKKIAISLFVVSTIVLLFFADKNWVIRETTPVNLYQTYGLVVYDRQLFFDMMSKKDLSKAQFDNVTNTLDSNSKHTFVILLGESASRAHQGVYGYKKETTPLMSSMLDELYLFNDVFSGDVSTNASLETALTFADNEHSDLKYKYGDIIDFFKAAGFKTFWLSNQFYNGIYDSAYAYIAVMSDVSHFMNKDSGLASKHYDGELLEHLPNFLSDNATNKVIFIHLMGSHQSFNARYPKEFEKYDASKITKETLLGKTLSKENQINAYDNSIAYTDYIWNEVIQMLKSANIGASYLLYFSDHGEDVYDSSEVDRIPRNGANPTPAMYEVPFLLWLSPEYKKQYADFIKDFDSYLDRPYQTDRVIHSIINLSRLKHDIINEQDSIFSDKFTPKKRTISGKEHFGSKEK